jgi:hypothetical protein
VVGSAACSAASASAKAMITISVRIPGARTIPGGTSRGVWSARPGVSDSPARLALVDSDEIALIENMP